MVTLARNIRRIRRGAQIQRERVRETRQRLRRQKRELDEAEAEIKRRRRRIPPRRLGGRGDRERIIREREEQDRQLTNIRTAKEQISRAEKGLEGAEQRISTQEERSIREAVRANRRQQFAPSLRQAIIIERDPITGGFERQEVRAGFGTSGEGRIFRRGEAVATTDIAQFERGATPSEQFRQQSLRERERFATPAETQLQQSLQTTTPGITPQEAIARQSLEEQPTPPPRRRRDDSPFIDVGAGLRQAGRGIDVIERRITQPLALGLQRRGVPIFQSVEAEVFTDPRAIPIALSRGLFTPAFRSEEVARSAFFAPAFTTATASRQESEFVFDFVKGRFVKKKDVVRSIAEDVEKTFRGTQVGGAVGRRAVLREQFRGIVRGATPKQLKSLREFFRRTGGEEGERFIDDIIRQEVDPLPALPTQPKRIGRISATPGASLPLVSLEAQRPAQRQQRRLTPGQRFKLLQIAQELPRQATKQEQRLRFRTAVAFGQPQAQAQPQAQLPQLRFNIPQPRLPRGRPRPRPRPPRRTPPIIPFPQLPKLRIKDRGVFPVGVRQPKFADLPSFSAFALNIRGRRRKRRTGLEFQPVFPGFQKQIFRRLSI